MGKIHKHDFLSLLKENRVTTVAGAWVYFFLTSLIPMVFLMVTAFGVFGVEITTDLIARLPEELRIGGEVIVNTAKSYQEGVTLLFIATVVFSSSALLNQMRKDGRAIYGVKQKDKRRFFNRVWAIFGIFILFLIFLLSAFLVAFGEKLFTLLPTSKGKRILVSLIVGLSITLLSYFVIILLNKYIIPVKIPVVALFSGSILSLAIIYLGTIILGVYLHFFGLNNAFYGSLAGIVVFLLWSYVMMLGLVIGTIFGFYLTYKRSSSNAKYIDKRANLC